MHSRKSFYIFCVTALFLHEVTGYILSELDTETNVLSDDTGWSQLNCSYANKLSELSTNKSKCNRTIIKTNNSTGFWTPDCLTELSTCIFWYNFSAVLSKKSVMDDRVLIPQSQQLYRLILRGFVSGDGGSILVTLRLFDPDKLVFWSVKRFGEWTDAIFNLTGIGLDENSVMLFELRQPGNSVAILDRITIEIDNPTERNISSTELIQPKAKRLSEIQAQLKTQYSRTNISECSDKNLNSSILGKTSKIPEHNKMSPTGAKESNLKTSFHLKRKVASSDQIMTRLNDEESSGTEESIDTTTVSDAGNDSETGTTNADTEEPSDSGTEEPGDSDSTAGTEESTDFDSTAGTEESADSDSTAGTEESNDSETTVGTEGTDSETTAGTEGTDSETTTGTEGTDSETTAETEGTDSETTVGTEGTDSETTVGTEGTDSETTVGTEEPSDSDSTAGTQESTDSETTTGTEGPTDSETTTGTEGPADSETTTAGTEEPSGTDSTVETEEPSDTTTTSTDEPSESSTTISPNTEESTNSDSTPSEETTTTEPADSDTTEPSETDQTTVTDGSAEESTTTMVETEEPAESTTSVTEVAPTTEATTSPSDKTTTEKPNNSESSTTESVTKSNPNSPKPEAKSGDDKNKINWRDRIGLYVGIVSILILLIAIAVMGIIYRVKKLRQITFVSDF